MRLATTRSMRSMAFGTAQSMPRSQQANYQGFTIWSCGKATLKKQILRNLHRQSSTFEHSLLSTTKIIQKSWQQHLPPSIRLCQGLGHLLYPGQQPSPQQLQQINETNLLGLRRLQERNMADLLASPRPISGKRSSRPLFCSISSGFPLKVFYL